MGRFEDMILGLKEDTEVPAEVWAKYTDTLENLPDQPEKRSIRTNRWVKYTASAASVVLAATAIFTANPALAARIPIIGSIFGEVQEISRFSGEYDDKATVLNTETTSNTETDEAEEADNNAAEGAGHAGTAGDAKGAINAQYVAEDAGVTVTASEIYCDGLSIFLTAQVEVEQGKLNNIPGNMMYLRGSWKTGADGQEIELENDNLEGKVIDDHTFVGMVKLDLDTLDVQDGEMELKLSRIGYDDVHELDAEDISESHKIEGEWDLKLPFTVDKEAVTRIPINKENNGYCLKEVFVSPYQVVTFTDVPYTMDTTTREEFEEMMDQKTGGTEDPGYTYEEYMAQQGKIYEPSDTIIFNQDGEKLQSWEEYQGRSVNAVDGKEVTKLYIYVFDEFDSWLKMAKEGIDCAAADRALIAAEVDVK